MKQYFAFQWHITDECDQRCKHCYIFSGNNCKALKSMSWEQMQSAFENCLEMCNKYNRLPYFYLTGGDPILHPDFWKLLNLFKENGVPFTILGNPFHLNDEVCRRLKDMGCEKYQMSLDGMEKMHDWFRKPGSFNCTLEKIQCIKKAGIRSVIMTTVSGTNISEIPDIIDTVVKHKVDVFAFARYCPTNRQQAAGEKEAGMTPQEYRALLDTCYTKFKAYEAAGCETYFNLKDHLWTLYLYEKGIFKIPEGAKPDMIYGGCNCGNCHLTILPTGDIYACRRLKSKVGNAFTAGQKVIALMGGMGRSFHGSYAEYALLPAHHVFAVDTSLSWDRLAAIPETYFTAWGSCFECLSLKSSDHLLVRGGTCALGYAAIQIAKALGCKVTATTHRESKIQLLTDCGADMALLDNGSLRGQVSGITKALELVGIKTLKNTLSCMEKGGIVCNTGNLGGVYTWNGFDPIKDIPNGVFLTGFFSNAPTQETINELFAFLNTHNLTPHIGKCYFFTDIAKACEDMENGKINGKIVINVEGGDRND